MSVARGQKWGIFKWQVVFQFISVDTIDAPLKEIQFPTLTFCHDENFQPDNWAIIENIFNFLDFRNDEKLRSDFEPVFRLLFNDVHDYVEETVKSKPEKSPIGKLQQEIIWRKYVLL